MAFIVRKIAVQQLADRCCGVKGLDYQSETRFDHGFHRKANVEFAADHLYGSLRFCVSHWKASASDFCPAGSVFAVSLPRMSGVSSNYHLFEWVMPLCAPQRHTRYFLAQPRHHDGRAADHEQMEAMSCHTWYQICILLRLRAVEGPSFVSCLLIASVGHRDEEEGEEEDEEKEDEEDEEEDENKPPPSRTQIAVKAVLLLVIGTAGCAVFSDPLVDAVSNFSKVLPPQSNFS